MARYYCCWTRYASRKQISSAALKVKVKRMAKQGVNTSFTKWWRGRCDAITRRISYELTDMLALSDAYAQPFELNSEWRQELPQRCIYGQLQVLTALSAGAGAGAGASSPKRSSHRPASVLAPSSHGFGTRRRNSDSTSARCVFWCRGLTKLIHSPQPPKQPPVQSILYLLLG